MSKNYDISKSGARKAEGRPSEASLMCFFESWLFLRQDLRLGWKRNKSFFAHCALVMVAKIQKLAYCC